jgi:hypothetical protein
MDILIAGAVLAALVLGVSATIIGWKLFFTDRAAYERNQRRLISVKDALKGNTPVVFGHGRDELVSAGLAWDRENRVFRRRGRLSDEAIDDVVS